MKGYTRYTKETGGARARAEAETNLVEAVALWPEVKRVAASLRELREANGFTEQIRLAMGVKK